MYYAYTAFWLVCVSPAYTSTSGSGWASADDASMSSIVGTWGPGLPQPMTFSWAGLCWSLRSLFKLLGIHSLIRIDFDYWNRDTLLEAAYNTEFCAP